MMRKNKIFMIAVIVMFVAILIMWNTSRKSSKPAEDVTIVTEMPVSGYQVGSKYDESSFDTAWVNGPVDQVVPFEADISAEAAVVPTEEPDVISSASTAAAAIATSSKEEYTAFAPASWRGDIL